MEITKRLCAASGCSSDAELSILITGDDEVRRLNAAYRGKDKPTDVLSFPAGQPAGAENLLGDIVISIDTALRQAKEFAVTPREELLRLLVHGLLHLLGYDHEGVKAADAQKMRRREARLLRLVAGDKLRNVRTTKKIEKRK